MTTWWAVDMVLHTLNASSTSLAFQDCLRAATQGDAILLLGEGVYGAITGSEACSQLQESAARVLVLDSDSLAAGLDTETLAFPNIDIDGFAALTEYYPRQLAWY